jgi:hypothetical protein
MEATIPSFMASRAMSAWLNRESGSPLSQGNSHASALICTTILGGKTARSPAPWTILKTGQALFKKPLSPFTDNLSWHIDSTGDFFVLKTFGSEKNDFGTHYFKIR